jgi:hypothetical protein
MLAQFLPLKLMHADLQSIAPILELSDFKERNHSHFTPLNGLSSSRIGTIYRKSVYANQYVASLIMHVEP